MVLRDYWAEERIHSQNNRLIKWPQKPHPKHQLVGTIESPVEVMTIEAFQPTDYKKTDLEEVTSSCRTLSKNQQNKLLQFLKLHESLFAGKRKEWKGIPVTISLIEGAKST